MTLRELSYPKDLLMKTLNNITDGLLLRVAGVVKESVVDGPGLRYVIFTQGCPHRCVGCHNPQTHNPDGGYDVTVEELLSAIIEIKLISGITLSGGEPFTQARSCAKLAQLVKQHGLNVVTYSGYYYSDLVAMAKNDIAVADLLQHTDILIDGPYDETKKDLNLPFRGSSNQNIIYLTSIMHD